MPWRLPHDDNSKNCPRNRGRYTQNKAFVSAVIQSTRVAVQTHQQEKLDALRHAVINVALGRSPDEDETAMFLLHVETLTPWHLRILRFFQDPPATASACRVTLDGIPAGALATVLEKCFPELNGRREFYEQITRDLENRGFLNSGGNILHTMMTASGLAAQRTTDIANRVLAFITAPPELYSR